MDENLDIDKWIEERVEKFKEHITNSPQTTFKMIIFWINAAVGAGTLLRSRSQTIGLPFQWTTQLARKNEKQMFFVFALCPDRNAGEDF